MISKDKVKGFVLGVATTSLILSGSVAFASPVSKSITAVYNNIKIVINGSEVTPNDSDGQVVEPFIYDGTTYLPVRAVAQVLNQQVEWDGASSTVYIDTKNSVSLTDDEAKEILNKLIPRALDIYGMFNGAGYFKIDATKTIPDEENYCIVTGVNGKHVNDTSNVKSIVDLKKVIEDVFTKDIAQKLFYLQYLTPEKDSPFYKDYEGNLYEDMNQGGHGFAEKFLIETAKVKGQKDKVAEIELDTTVLGDPGDRLTISIVYENGKWLLASPLVL